MSSTPRGWAAPVQPSGFVLSWIKYPHLTGKNYLECFRSRMENSPYSALHLSIARNPQTVQGAAGIPEHSMGNEETAAIPRRKRDPTSLEHTNGTELFLCLLPEKPDSTWDKLGTQIPFPAMIQSPSPPTHPTPEGRNHSQKSWFKVSVHGSNSQKISFPNISTERNASSRICNLPFRNGLENCKNNSTGKKNFQPPREQHLQLSPGKIPW